MCHPPLISFNFVHFSARFASRFMLFHPLGFPLLRIQAITPQFAVVCGEVFMFSCRFDLGPPGASVCTSRSEIMRCRDSFNIGF